jgi:hypothetical protein
MAAIQDLEQKLVLAWQQFEVIYNEVDAAIAEVSRCLDNRKEFSVMPKYEGVLAPPGYPAVSDIENSLAQIECECEKLARSIARRKKALDEILAIRQKLPAPVFPQNIVF